MLDDDLTLLQADPSDAGAWFRIGRALRQGEADRALPMVRSRLEVIRPATTYSQVAQANALNTIEERERNQSERQKPPTPAKRKQSGQNGRQGEPAQPRRRKELGESTADRTDRIREIIENRRITSLLHFTRLSHLNSILECGIVPRDELRKRGQPFEPNDERRWDGATDASSLSISWPNYKMFYHLRKHRFPKVLWTVLEIAPEILWELHCAFCSTNAANAGVTDREIEERSKSASLEDLFAERASDGTSRADCSIPDSFPTDPQAEVLVFGTIPPWHIRCAYVEDTITLRRVPKPHPTRIMVVSRYFGPRSDYQLWRPQSEWL